MKRFMQIAIYMAMMVIAVSVVTARADDAETGMSVECERSTEMSATVKFIFEDTGGGVLQETEVRDAKTAACNIEVRTEGKTVEEVRAEYGKVYDLEATEEGVKFKWTGKRGETEEIHIVVGEEAAGGTEGEREEPEVEIEYEKGETLHTKLRFEVEDEEGKVLAQREVSDGASDGNEIKVRVEGYEVVDVEADIGVMYSEEYEEGEGSYVWTGTPGVTVTFRVKVRAETEAVGSVGGTAAKVEYERCAGGQSVMLVVRRGGSVVQESELTDVKPGASRMRVVLTEGEVETVRGSGGEVVEQEVSGGEARFVWESSGEGTIEVVIQESWRVYISANEALKLKYAAGVPWELEGVAVNGVELAASGAGYEGEVCGEAWSWKVELLGSGERVTARGFVWSLDEEGWTVTATGLCVVEYYDGDTLLGLEVVEEGGRLSGEIRPERSGEEFTGWRDASGPVEEAQEVRGDLKLYACWTKVTGYERHIVRVSAALVKELGARAESVRIELEGERSSGNADYAHNGWDAAREWYVVSNCEAESEGDARYSQRHVALRELCGIRMYWETEEGVENELYVSADALEVWGKAEEVYIGVKEEGVELAYGEGFAYMEGRSETEFAPEAEITRAETAVLYYRCLTEESRGRLTGSGWFADVPSGAWYSEAVRALAGAGMLKGRSEELFEPEASVTRAEFVAIAVRLLGLERRVEADMYSDIAWSWARREINAAAAAGLIGGYPDGSFRPDGAITRAEAVTVMNAMLGRRGESSGENPWSDVSADAWYYNEVMLATVR